MKCTAVRTPRGLAAVLLVVLLAGEAQAISLTKGPYLQRVTASSIVVMWQTSEAGDSRVDYGPTASYGSARYDGSAAYLHTVTLPGLAANSQYHYRVVSTAGDSAASVDATFWTAPGTATSFRFADYGDTQSEVHADVAQSILASAPRFVLHAGDLCNDGSQDSLWQSEFFDPGAAMLRNTPLFTALGNHEGISPLYYDYLEPPLGGGVRSEEWYSFDYGGAHFTVLDTNADYSPGSAQYAWLVNDLQSTGAVWKFVVHHHPAYSSGGHGGTEEVQAYLVPRYEQYGVAVVFSGHDHLYERSLKSGVYYIVSGGGGGHLEEPDQNSNPYQQVVVSAYHHCTADLTATTATLRAVGTDGSVYDTVTLSRPGPPPTAAFSATPTQGLAPLTVAFTDQSTNGPTAWWWQFGDGGTSSAQHPTHQYAAPNRYTVSLTAANAYGSDTETKTDWLRASFPDVPLSYWNVEDILTCVSEGIVRGYADGTYQPKAPVLRDALAVFVARAVAGGEGNVPNGPLLSTFPDVPKTHWAYKYIEYCAARGIVKGYEDGYYGPSDPVTRDQMAVYVARAQAGGDSAVPPGLGTPSFPDVPSTYWAYRYIEYAHAKGIVYGYGDGQYHPRDPVLRDQMATFIARLLAAGLP